jgi:hypothetical protein
LYAILHGSFIGGLCPGKMGGMAGNARHFQQRQEAKEGSIGNVTKQ